MGAGGSRTAQERAFQTRLRQLDGEGSGKVEVRRIKALLVQCREIEGVNVEKVDASIRWCTLEMTKGSNVGGKTAEILKKPEISDFLQSAGLAVKDLITTCPGTLCLRVARLREESCKIVSNKSEQTLARRYFRNLKDFAHVVIMDHPVIPPQPIEIIERPRPSSATLDPWEETTASEKTISHTHDAPVVPGMTPELIDDLPLYTAPTVVKKKKKVAAKSKPVPPRKLHAVEEERKKPPPVKKKSVNFYKHSAPADPQKTPRLYRETKAAKLRRQGCSVAPTNRTTDMLTKWVRDADAAAAVKARREGVQSTSTATLGNPRKFREFVSRTATRHPEFQSSLTAVPRSSKGIIRPKKQRQQQQQKPATPTPSPRSPVMHNNSFSSSGGFSGSKVALLELDDRSYAVGVPNPVWAKGDKQESPNMSPEQTSTASPLSRDAGGWSTRAL
eukprot:TRINITY_DN14527_c0_g3_i1.p1 TRINITY_DN14527_c0_g3~~TRINITY_DN14527_c0_g3_i1.p1  ORF type:complete len:446 (+),score=62.72 TRINITY_DN14527_c0_g3_i1:73-1410(+)